MGIEFKKGDKRNWKFYVYLEGENIFRCVDFTAVIMMCF